MRGRSNCATVRRWRARLWPAAAGTHGIEPAKLFVEHIKLNKAGGFGAILARASLSVPGITGLLKKGPRSDECRVGTECGSPFRSRWSTDHYKKKIQE